jgi:hypothetical protein
MATQPFDNGETSSFGRAVGEIGGNIFNRTLGRLFGAGLNRGAEGSDKINASARWNTRSGQTDWRVKLTLPSEGTLRQLFFGGGNSIMRPLSSFNGMVFPLTPSVLIQHTASYNPMAATHSNYPFYAYGHSEVSAITVIGEFPVQNSEDARHWVATLHFLRAVTKMFFGGEDNSLKGNPPPILQLNGYGNHVFNNVPVIVTNFTVDLRNTVDYISTDQSRGTFTDARGNVSSSRQIDNSAIADDLSRTVTNPDINRTWAPTDSQFNVQLQPVYSRETIKKFSMQQFVNGSLSNKDGIGFI